MRRSTRSRVHQHLISQTPELTPCTPHTSTSHREHLIPTTKKGACVVRRQRRPEITSFQARQLLLNYPFLPPSPERNLVCFHVPANLNAVRWSGLSHAVERNVLTLSSCNFSVFLSSFLVKKCAACFEVVFVFFVFSVLFSSKNKLFQSCKQRHGKRCELTYWSLRQTSPVRHSTPVYFLQFVTLRSQCAH